MSTPSTNPVGPEFNGPSPTVVSHMTPRSSPYHWSTRKPSVQGWYFCRRPNISNNGWDTRVVKVWQRNTAEPLQGAWQHDLVLLITDPFWNVANWSFETIPEPLAGS